MDNMYLSYYFLSLSLFSGFKLLIVSNNLSVFFHSRWILWLDKTKYSVRFLPIFLEGVQRLNYICCSSLWRRWWPKLSDVKKGLAKERRSLMNQRPIKNRPCLKVSADKATGNHSVIIPNTNDCDKDRKWNKNQFNNKMYISVVR